VNTLRADIAGALLTHPGLELLALFGHEWAMRRTLYPLLQRASPKPVTGHVLILRTDLMATFYLRLSSRNWPQNRADLRFEIIASMR